LKLVNQHRPEETQTPDDAPRAAGAQQTEPKPPSDNASSNAPEGNVPAEEAAEEAAQAEDAQKAGDDEAAGSSDLLGTFSGVFRPTVLTILGLMMYVREGWVVGQAGLLGTVLIIALTFVISGSAALSLSSITTNIHVGAGGVFSIISQSLGLESGGSIGVPFYLGQALSAALYVYGFMEAWRYLFPGHSMWLVVYGIFAVIFLTTLFSTRLAFRLQGVVMIVILASLVSIVLGLTSVARTEPLHSPQLWGAFEAGGFWVLFAIFFPAGTGVNVGASMSGALGKPRRSIPVGTLAAVGTALVVYLGMAVWYSMVASPEELRANQLIVIERAALGELVLAGILASTFTAALSAMVAAPRVLQALAEQNVVPGSDFFGRLTASREPRNAILATGALVAAAMLLGSLDAVAVLITMFFLLTYLTINLVVAIEQSLGLVAFRPTFRIPRWVPLVGVGACVAALFIINALIALVALGVVFGIYVLLVGRQLETPWQTVRSSIFVSLADWATKRIGRSPEEANERAWKPDLLVPVTSRGQLDGIFRLLRVLSEPKGSLKIVGVRGPSSTRGGTQDPSAAQPSSAEEFPPEDAPEDRPQPEAAPEDASSEEPPPSSPSDGFAAAGDDLDTLPSVTQSFYDEQLMATSVVIDAPSLLDGVRTCAAVMRGSAFRPNVLFGLAHHYDAETLQGFVDVATEHRMGVALFYEHPEAALNQERRVNVWASDQSPEWELGLRLPNLDLSVLLGYQVLRNWRAHLRLLTVCRDEEQQEPARDYLRRLIEDARLPAATDAWVRDGDFLKRLQEAPRADLNVLGLPEEVDPAFLKEVVQRTHSSCLFVRDSQHESALA
jgi:amino acid transporter